MEPKRILLVEPLTLHDGRVLQQWIQVWKIGADDDGRRVVIEYQGRQYKIPASSAVETPVSTPSLEKLAELDRCFAYMEQRLQETYCSDEHMFIYSQCPHGNLFLRDTRGGIAMYTVTIFMGRVEDRSKENLERLWKKYHDMPTDAIYSLGIGR